MWLAVREARPETSASSDASSEVSEVIQGDSMLSTDGSTRTFAISLVAFFDDEAAAIRRPTALTRTRNRKASG